MLALFLLSVAMAAGAFWIAVSGSPLDYEVWLGGYLGTPFFALGAFLIGTRIFSRRVEIRIDGDGVYWRRWRPEPIPLSAIRSARVVEVSRTRMLGLSLHEPQRFVAANWWQRKIAAANRKLGYGEVFLVATGTDRSFDDLVAAFDMWFAGSGQMREGDVPTGH